MSEIYYTDARADVPFVEVAHGRQSWFQPGFSLIKKMEKMIQKSRILNIIEKGDQVALKMHWGTLTTTRLIRSIFIRKIVEMIHEKSAYAFLTESVGLGMGKPRNYGVGRLQLAQVAGYTYETCLAPLIPADGLQGFDHKLVKVDGQQLKEVYVAKMIAEADKVISVAHVKAHPRGGIGGALKNLGVGCVAKPSKYMIHVYNEYPQIDKSICDKCGKCREICPADAITEDYEILPERCKDYRCVGCNEVCRGKGAIPLKWTDSKDASIRFADAAKAVIETVGNENLAYLNLILDVTPVCDCVPFSDLPVVPDLGVLAGLDPLAIDKASLDLINRAPIVPGSVLTESVENKLAAIYTNSFQSDPNYLMEAAQKLKLGSLEYILHKI
ncbi:MAG: DUF362 domain-containing protein [Candidatus Helarchaeota archaeon]